MKTIDNQYKRIKECEASSHIIAIHVCQPVDLEFIKQLQKEKQFFSCFKCGYSYWPAKAHAELIESLQAENKVLREALEKLRDCDWTISLPDRMDAVRYIAREALEKVK